MSNKTNEYEEANQYTTKAMRDHLSDLSLLAFGARGKWKKLCNQLGLSIYGIKEQMEVIIEHKRQYLESIKRQEVRPRETENDADTTSSTDGSGQGDDLRG